MVPQPYAQLAQHAYAMTGYMDPRFAYQMVQTGQAVQQYPVFPNQCPQMAEQITTMTQNVPTQLFNPQPVQHISQQRSQVIETRLPIEGNAIVENIPNGPPAQASQSKPFNGNQKLLSPGIPESGGIIPSAIKKPVQPVTFQPGLSTVNPLTSRIQNSGQVIPGPVINRASQCSPHAVNGSQNLQNNGREGMNRFERQQQNRPAAFNLYTTPLGNQASLRKEQNHPAASPLFQMNQARSAAPPIQYNKHAGNSNDSQLPQNLSNLNTPVNFVRLNGRQANNFYPESMPK